MKPKYFIVSIDLNGLHQASTNIGAVVLYDNSKGTYSTKYFDSQEDAVAAAEKYGHKNFAVAALLQEVKLQPKYERTVTNYPLS